MGEGRRRSHSFAGFSNLKRARVGAEAGDRAATKELSDASDLSQAPTRERLLEEYAREGAPGLPSRAHLEVSKALRELRRAYPDFRPMEHLELEPVLRRASALGPLKEVGYRLRLAARPLDSGDGRGLWLKLHAILALALLRMLRDARATKARGQLVLLNPRLLAAHSSKWDWTANLSLNELLIRLSAAVQSDESIRLEDTTIVLRFVDMEKIGVEAAEPLQMRQGSIQDWLRRTKSIVNPTSGLRLTGRDGWARNMCLPLALVVGRYYVDAKVAGQPLSAKHSNWLFRPKGKLEAAKRLIREAGLSGAGWGPFGEQEDLAQLCAALGGSYRVHVFTGVGPPRVSYGPDSGKKICILLMRGHAYFVSNVKAFLRRTRHSGSTRLCWRCFKVEPKAGPGKYQAAHRCGQTQCRLCEAADCPNRRSREARPWDLIVCHICLDFFQTETCHRHHLGTAGCQARVRCRFCHKRIPDPAKMKPAEREREERNHRNICGRRRCDTCGALVGLEHRCFLSKPKGESVGGRGGGGVGKRPRFYGDIESCVGEKDGVQRPNLLILERSAHSAAELQHGPDKGYDRRVYRGLDCIQQFVQELIASDSIFRHSFIIFHNMGGYDGHFIFSALVGQDIQVEPTCRGQRFLNIHIPSARADIRDSLLYIPNTSLADLPGMYGLEGERKGCFPHRLNTPRWHRLRFYREGRQRFPHKRYFDPEGMRPGPRQAFDAWWAAEDARFKANPRLMYDVPIKLEHYCSNDVVLLRKSFEQFIRAASEQYPETPVLRAITTPAFCNLAYRHYHMPERSIALLPPQGYRQTQSKRALAWLAWQEELLELDELRHARNSSELELGGGGVDGVGFRLRDGVRHMYVFEFAGCHWHRHPGSLCGQRRKHPFPHTPCYQRTLERQERLKRLSQDPESPYGCFTLVWLWECELKREMEREPAVRHFIHSFERGLQARGLSPRATLAGGLCGPLMHDVQCAPDEAIAYLDFKSLYPAVNACVLDETEYPIGHPHIYLSTQCQRRWPGGVGAAILSGEAFGFVHLRVVPPPRLLHPVLHMHVEGKLLFPLCRSCALEQRQSSCEHSVEQRALVGHYTTPEVRQALRLGYQILRDSDVFEVWHFTERSKTLLRPYIFEAFLEKEKASGFPVGVESPEEKEAYAQRLSASLGGLPVEPSQIAVNAGRRSLSKFIANNLWGFFAKREDATQTEVLQDRKSFQRLLEVDNDPSKELLSAEILGPAILLTWKPVEERPGRKTSVALASFTTAMARLRLMGQMRILGRSLVYVDTDSVFYIERLGEKKRPLAEGPGLGELQNELEQAHPGKSPAIVSFVCPGSKSYFARIMGGLRRQDHLGDLLRFKGLTLTCGALASLTPAEMRKLVLDRKRRHSVKVEQLLFRKSIVNRRVETLNILKSASFTSTKRRLLENSPRLDTVPYGFVDEPPGGPTASQPPHPSTPPGPL